MRLLEVVHGGSDSLKLVFETQRDRLRTGAGLRTISIERMPVEQAAALVKKNIVDFTPTAILLRGVYGIPAILGLGTKIPVYLDHCTPAQLGKTTPLREHLHKVRRAIAYSQAAENDLRDAGLGRIHLAPGPFLPGFVCPPDTGSTTVAVLDTCPSSQKVLATVKQMAASKGWDVKFVSPIVVPGITRVANNVEAAERAELLLAIYDEMDFGQPHEAAILALGFRRALATSRNLAFSLLPYPASSFISAPAHAIGSFGAAIEVYLRNKEPFLQWPEKAKINHLELPDTLLGWMHT